MMKADEVEAMLRLHKLGWGTRRIAREFGCSRNTVKRYVEARGWVSYGGAGRAGKLAGLDGGWRSVSCSTAATPRWCARISSASCRSRWA